MAMPERAQLLQRLELLEGRLRQARERAQEIAAVAVDADVAQRRRIGQAAMPRRSRRATTAMGARLKYSARPCASQHDLHHVRVGELGDRRDRHARPCSSPLRGALEQRGHGVDERRDR
jgi:hypothetical protein